MSGIKHAIRQRMKSVFVSRDINDAYVLQFKQSKAVATSGAKNATLVERYTIIIRLLQTVNE